MEQWLPDRAPAAGDSARGHRGRLGVQTWQQYHEALRHYVVPHIGGLRLQKLTARDLDDLYDTLESSGGRKGAGLAPKTIANVHGIVHKALTGTGAASSARASSSPGPTGRSSTRRGCRAGSPPGRLASRG
jgi:hypothetical protein